jgi:hypothetical protein
MSKEQSAESDARPDKKKKKDVERATVRKEQSPEADGGRPLKMSNKD